MSNHGRLSTADHENLSAFLDTVLRRHGAGEMSEGTAKGVLMAVMSSLDSGDIHAVRRWIDEGRPAPAARS